MRALLTVGLIWLFGGIATVSAQEAAPYQAGTHYVELPSAAPTEEPGKIEVAELFWYGCGHCFTFEPIIKEWKKDLPEDVHFRPVPALFGGAWNTHGQLFYTLQSLDKLDEAHMAVFEAMHNDRNPLANEAAMVELLEPLGITEQEFKRAWSSFGVKSKMDQASRLVKSYRATGVPTIIVNGKYRIEGGMAGGLENMLSVAEFLIEKERQQP